MWNKLADKWNEFINFDEENNGTSDNLDNNSLGSGANHDWSNESTTKSVNGGPGSGNFGHAGRPGRVGGSAPVGSVQTEYAWPTTPEERQKMLDRFRKDELVKKMRRMRTIASFDDAHIAAMQEAGFTDDQIQKWKEKILAKQLVNIEKSEKTKELRKRAKESPEQTQAIDSLVANMEVAPKDETWLRNNCSPEMAMAFSTEVEKARKMGIENIKLRLNDADSTNGSMGYSESDDRFNLTISKKILRDWEATLESRKQRGPNGSKWWTNDEVGGTFSHEFGHSMEWQFIKKFTGSMKQFPSTMVSGLYDYAANLIVNEAKTNVIKSGVRQDDLRINKDSQFMSRYGRANSHESIAESFANPDYSVLTKEIYNIATGRTSLGKERMEKLNQSIESIQTIVKERFQK